MVVIFFHNPPIVLMVVGIPGFRFPCLKKWSLSSGQPAHATCSHRVLSRQALLTTTFHCLRRLVSLRSFVYWFGYEKIDGWRRSYVSTWSMLMEAHFRRFLLKSWNLEPNVSPHISGMTDHSNYSDYECKKKCKKCRPWIHIKRLPV